MAYSVVVDPISFSRFTVEFIGPLLEQLKRGTEHHVVPLVRQTGHPENAATVGLGPALRAWQDETGEVARQAVGRIRYSDHSRREFVTYYSVGIDVMNTESGIVVRFLEQR